MTSETQKPASPQPNVVQPPQQPNVAPSQPGQQTQGDKPNDKPAQQK
jgi:hypothetical protein